MAQPPPTPAQTFPQQSGPGPSQTATGKRKRVTDGPEPEPGSGATGNNPGASSATGNNPGPSSTTGNNSGAAGGSQTQPTGQGQQPEAGPSARRRRIAPTLQPPTPKSKRASDWHIRKADVPANAKKTKVCIF